MEFQTGYSRFTIGYRGNMLRVMGRCHATDRCHIGCIGRAGHFTAHNWYRQCRSIEQRLRFTVHGIDPSPCFGSQFPYQSLSQEFAQNTSGVLDIFEQ